MGSIGGLLGLNGGINGTGFNTQNPVTQDQLNNSQQIEVGQQRQQQALINALQQQNGIGNQSQVYNQLQGVANGTGPNPAQAMLNQATGANVANQASLMAGQRGAGANAGLIARQAAMQGANTQQQAAGQGATMQANQALNAIGQAGNIAGQQVQNQIGATNTGLQGAQSEQQLLHNAMGQYNSTQAGLAGQTMQGQQGLIGGVLGGAGAALAEAQGGEIPKMYADGGDTDQSGGMSSLGSFFSKMGQSTSQNPLQTGMAQFGAGFGNALKGSPSTPMTNAGYQMPQIGNQFSQAPSNFDGLGPTPQASNFGGLGADTKLSKGGNVGSKLKSGGHVPGKPKVPGNSYANDTVKALLSPGEVVIPNSVMQSKDPVRGAAQFVQAIMAKKRGKNG